MQPKDTAYFRDPNKPDMEIRACVMHESFPSIETYRIGPVGAFDGVDYGLCTACHVKLGAEPNYQKEIDAEVHKRLKDLTQTKGH